MEGWIRLYRKSIENQLYFSEPFTRWQAWMDMCIIANHKPGWFIKRGIRVDVGVGQIGWDLENLAKRWKWSRGKVERFFCMLENDGQIIRQKSNVTTLISICNYGKYQTDSKAKSNVNSKANDKADGHQTAKQTDTNKNVKKKKKNDKEEIDESISLKISDEEREKIFQIFFFEKGIINPEKEIQRFIAHYEKTGWKDANGNAIVSKTACALNWSTKEVTGSYSDFMNRWKIIYYEGAKQYPDACRIMYQGLKGVVKENSTITLTAKKELWEFVENSEPQLSNLICGLIKKNLPGYNFKWNVLKN